MSDEQIANARAGYYGNIEHIDNEIGRIIDELNRQEILNNTMIVFTSDHGDMLADHCLWRKTYAYEGSAHIPMLVRLPDNLSQNCLRKCNAPVTLMDIMPTILDVLGLDIPDSVDGSSMLPLLYGKECDWRDYIQGEHSAGVCSKEGMFYLTDGKIKYIWFPKSGTEQLFDLDNDPYETIDLANSVGHNSLLFSMRKRLVKELEPRNSVLTSGHELVTYSGPIVSPNYEKRIKNSFFEWRNAGKYKRLKIQI
jgi:arylsulfatase A-like enzyme